MSSLKFTQEELDAFRSEYAKGATDSQFTLFISECERRGLRPGAHLVFQLRNAKEYDPTVGASVFVKKPYWITTISALLLIAERTGKYDGASAPEYIYLDDDGNPSVVSEIPLPDKNNRTLPREPWAVRVKIRRKDFSEPIVSVVRFDSVAATQKRENSIVLTDMWVKRPGEQCAKCALANGIRIGFPEEAGHLFLSEEIKSEEEEKATPTPVTPASVVPVPPSAPPVNQKPAEPTTAPRPGEITGTEYHVHEVPATLPKGAGDTLKVVPKESGHTSGQPVPTTNPEPKEAKPVESAKEAAMKAVPDLKPASEIKPKKGRPAKSPNNGLPPVEGITDADIPKPGETLPEPVEVNKAETEKFVESLDPTPTKEEQAGFTARVRALAAAGALNPDLKNYILNDAKKEDPKQLTVSNWNNALVKLEAALAESKDKLKEITKAAPLPKF